MINIRMWPVVHQGIRKHQINISLKLHRGVYQPVSHFGLYRLQVNGALHNLVVIGGFRFLYRVVEYVTVTVLRDLGVEHVNELLETFPIR